MLIFIVIVFILVIIIYLKSASDKQLKYEVAKEGGIQYIFSNLEQALFEAEFILYQNKITSLEYHNKINDYSFLKLEIKKTFDPSPYQMQMIHILNGKVNKKTMPYIITPQQSTEQFTAMLLKMGYELTEKLADDVRDTFLQ